MNAAEKLEITCSKAWPPLVEDPLGEWRLRWADGFTGRANSALAVGDPVRPLGGALRAVCDFAHDRGITPMVQVVRDSPNEHAIAAAGWHPATGHGAGHEVVVLTAPLEPGPAVAGGEVGRKPAVPGVTVSEKRAFAAPGVTVRDQPAPANPAVTIGDEPAPGWWALAMRPTEDSPAARQVLSGGKTGYGAALVDGVLAGVVRGALVDDWLHIGRLEVAPAFRRRGLASALMGAVHAWGVEHGAGHAVLQVAERNSGALALYAGLGYAPHHKYRYWVPAPGSCEDSTS
ncbi:MULTISPECIES: GNAT family N-acetyltransferase [unclassified Amycolatopsis]|uniref:GNAT family N-acetyltransferase n=1 Tax=unclassified Amycolatopsis TaxID=2618356 RepID=UPI0028768318|nr:MULTISPECIES: GNAT family N-acetyltransferase [unclassified Amycolatopsis]MDS0135113.1 GNAT family N-acetyltransferase [Amycolatopsis sp. 505]MDS0143110.1 GNAT family N-acetyltransferase [Amycolatopsis sp. CM201R]